MSAHTPGPWGRASLNIRRIGGTVEPVKHIFGAYVPGKGEQDVACIDRDDQHAEADANLIAAAPDLLEACEALVAGVEDSVLRFLDSHDLSLRADMDAILRARVERARAAITRARGGA